ncbi:MAG: hypothetical protein A2Y38_01215 [Spirochaetes bacterium GWB1_59_5]|nr:MAG: hypothetical protein A2Y38_01215 [Spirochaetes bacterium GWB1_59_5]
MSTDIRSEDSPEIRRQKLLEGADPRLVERFREYHAKNPQIYERFRELALSVYKAGRRHYSAWAIMNIIRWEHDLKTTGSEFKLSNDFIALYSRLMILNYPMFTDFFTLKQMGSHDNG